MHYGTFYLLKPPPKPTGKPRVMVVGNCQAESLRILLETADVVDSFRIPPIHEWTDEDYALACRHLKSTDVLVMQPVRENYRGLPCGTAQLATHLPRGARVITFPVLRFDGLFPYHAIVRSPAQPWLNPPVVPYHDLRILSAAWHTTPTIPSPQPSLQVLRALAAMSIEQLRRREQHHRTVVVSDFLERTPIWHTLNHPDNATLMFMAQRVLDVAGLAGDVADPGRELLGNLDAPVDKRAARALGVDVTGREEWSPAREGIALEHRAFYAEHPEIVRAGIERHRDRLELLELL
ncbi:hypothetical protein FHE74_01640 [Corynebacterium tapiri]|uniref:Polysaccharide biosynthesis enzyme WcbI domain-containing protein n=2 Tax=Corynebacterium tapiri TaxID=1448266 RepID=A0A5C4U868_9CORY|nr:hypothetical protein FHE74_01640 [Corynebacterium tapiri]